MAFSPISRIQQDVIQRIGGDKFLAFIRLYQGWKDIVGELLAAKSHPFRFQHSILYIAVQNNSWQQELFLHKGEILRQCKARTAAEIKDIIFLIRS